MGVVLLYGLSFWQALWLGGLSRTQLPDRLDLSPNEGIRRSLKHGLLFSTCTLSAMLFLGVLSWIAFGTFYSMLATLLFCLLIGLAAGLEGGLRAVERHLILRYLLARNNIFPWKAVSFLEDATGCILLRRVGGGYCFIHRLLLEYFADLETPSPSTPLPTVPSTQQ
jgi:eukaryotic-like serine/threonine-protein kinase